MGRYAQGWPRCVIRRRSSAGLASIVARSSSTIGNINTTPFFCSMLYLVAVDVLAAIFTPSARRCPV
jgi:hypothetical protein